MAAVEAPGKDGLNKSTQALDHFISDLVGDLNLMLHTWLEEEDGDLAPSDLVLGRPSVGAGGDDDVGGDDAAHRFAVVGLPEQRVSFGPTTAWSSSPFPPTAAAAAGSPPARRLSQRSQSGGSLTGAGPGQPHDPSPGHHGGGKTHRKTQSATSASLQALVQLQKDVFLQPVQPGDGEMDDDDVIAEDDEPGSSGGGGGGGGGGAPPTSSASVDDAYMAALPTAPVTLRQASKRKSVTALVDDRPESFDNKPEALLHMRSWYRPDCTRFDVARLLNGPEQQGNFLVRPSGSYNGNLVLCLSFQGIILHFLLDRYVHAGPFNGGCRVSGGKGPVFRSVTAFVAYHTKHRGNLPCLLRLSEDVAPSAIPVKSDGTDVPSPVLDRRQTYKRTLSETSDSGSKAPARPMSLDMAELARSLAVPLGSSVGADSEFDEDDDDDEDYLQIGGIEVGAAAADALSLLGKGPVKRKSFVQTALKQLKSFVPRRSPSQKVASFVNRLVSSTRSTEGRTVQNFLICTKESTDMTPLTVFSNIRQFVDGMRNYFITQHGERLEGILDRQTRLSQNEAEYVNLDGIIESSLMVHAIEPLRDYVRHCIVSDLDRQGALNRVRDNMRRIRLNNLTDFGVNERFKGIDWEPVVEHLGKMHRSPNPIRKLKYLLTSVTLIHETVGKNSAEGEHVVLGADDFLPLFIHVILEASIEDIEVDAEYMWGLLDPSLLTGEGGYYLTTLSSAVHVLKTFEQSSVPSKQRVPCMDDMQGFQKIFFADDQGRDEATKIVFKTFPIRPDMDAELVTEMIVRKLNFPRDAGQIYALFEQIHEIRRRLRNDECPQIVKASWPADRSIPAYRIVFAREDPDCEHG